MAKEVLVLGAGIVGVSVAVHLAQRGHTVTLMDRKAPGEETSLGNAGLIQREGVVPYGFPQELSTARSATGSTTISMPITTHAPCRSRSAKFSGRNTGGIPMRSRHRQVIAKLLCAADRAQHSVSEHAPS